MILFAVCSKETGQILRVGGTNEPSAEGQASQGEFVVVLDHLVSDETHYWDGGIVEFPPKPSPHHVWDFLKKIWYDPRTQEDLYNAKAAEIKLRRDKALSSGTTVSGTLFPTDELTQTRITGAAVSALLDPAYTVRWKMPNGEFVVLQSQEILGLAQAVRAHVQQCFDREADLIDALKSGQPYDLNVGWPQVEAQSHEG